jgi:glycosyltransferase involved in cell wall biosynthesis
MARPPRLLMLLDRLQEVLGGGERTALRLATDLPARGYEVWMATTHESSGWPLEALADAGVRHVDASRTGRYDYQGLAPLWRTLRDEQIDIVHAHMYGSNVWGTLMGRLARTPAVIAHEHSWPFEGDPVKRVIDGMIGRTADAFVAVSEADAELMRTYERVPARKVHVIPSAWEAREGDESADLRAELGIPAGAPVVGTLAVLRRVKRLELLVEAFATVLQEIPDAWLLIVGDGHDRPQVEAAIERFGVGHRTRMPGMRENIDSVWRALDVAAMSSDREGTPMAVLEALAHGVPMVAPAVGGIPEILSRGGGVLVPRHDVPALAREIAALLSDPDRRAAVGREGRERSERYTVTKQVDRCVALYEELLDRPRAHRRRNG